MSFKRIYYDYGNNKIYHWFTDENGKTRREEVHPKIEYFIKDHSKRSKIVDIYGNPVVAQHAENRWQLKERVERETRTYEAGIPEEIKFLQNRYGDQELEVNMENFQVATIDIEVEAEKEFPKPELAKYPINLITIHLSKQNQYYTFGLRDYTGDSELVKNYMWCADEISLIRNFILFFRKMKVDIITGWYCRKFDIPYIIQRCENLGIEETLSPVNEYKKRSEHAGYHIEGGGYEICGLSILDGLDLFKNFEREKQENYQLNTIGMLVCKEGKIVFDGLINDLWKRDWNKFVEYNVQDVILTKKINDKKRYIELAIYLCYQTLVPFEKVFSSINLVTGYIIRYLHKKGIVLPDREKDIQTGELPGAYVMAREGLHKYCMNFDVESMYPHMIMRYNISPETLVLYPDDPTGLIKTPVEGVYYRKDKVGVMADIVSRIFSERKRFKGKYEVMLRYEKGMTLEEIAQDWGRPLKFVKELFDEAQDEHGNSDYYDRQQYTRKILANSVYGDISNKFFVFYNLNNAKVVTLGGQSLIKYLSSMVNDYMRQNINDIIKMCWPETTKQITLENNLVILIDTDSNYICFDEIIEKLGIQFKDNKEFRDWCLTINEKFFEPFFDKILKDYFADFGIDEIVNFRKEKIITKMLILAKKKYAMEVIDKEGEFFEEPKLSITGIEVVRTDTPKYCRTRLKEVLKEIFHTLDRNSVMDMLRKIYDEFMEQPIEDIALPTGIKDYQKYALSIEEYLENGLTYKSATPIHVRASLNYNYMVAKYQLPYQMIDNGSKVKYVFVHAKANDLRQNVVAFIGKWPNEFNEHFLIDKEELWDKSFQSIVQRFFDVLQWGTITFDECNFDELEALCS